MDIFFRDPNEIPLPPEEVRILDFTATPYPDGRRVRIYLEVTPFQERPSVELISTNAQGHQVAQVSIVESISRKMELTMHLRGPQPVGEYRVEAQVFYTPHPEPADGEQNKPPETVEQITPQVVDRGETYFTIPDEAQESD
jgi:hypothetical protein